MACAGIGYAYWTPELWGSDTLHALKLIDISGIIGPINSNHLKNLKGYFGYRVQDFSKFVKTGHVDTGADPGVNADPGAIADPGAGPGANGPWTISASTAPTSQWAGLNRLIGRLMQQVPLQNGTYETLLQFTGDDVCGILLASGGGAVYAMTGYPTDSKWDPTALNCMQPVDYQFFPVAMITNVYYRIHANIYDAVNPPVNPFANARMVVANALGAVFADNLLDIIRKRPERQPIREALRGGSKFDLYVGRRSNKKWKLVKRTGDVGSFGEAVPLEGETANILEKLRTRLDRTDMQQYHAPAKPSATERFAMLKAISTQMVDIISGGAFAAGSTPGLPPSVIKWFNALTISLHGENPDEYTTQKWDATLELYIQQFSEFTDIITGNATGSFMKLHAIGRAGLIAGEGELTVTGAGTGTADANSRPPRPTPEALEAAADMLSQLAVVKGQLERARSGSVDRIPGIELRYAHITIGVKINGKKRFLTMVKMKESCKNSVYVAQFVDNGYELIPNRTAWCNAPRY